MQTSFPSERSTYRDEATGATVIQWTNGTHKSQHLYFTSPSVTADDRWLIFLSERSESPNLYAIDRQDGRIRLLSRNERGLLRSYVYPQGREYGISKASPCLEARHNLLCYIQDDSAYAVDLNVETAHPRKICDLPRGWYSAFNHISPDGKTLCVPCTDPQAFVDPVDNQWDQMRKVPGRMEREKLTSRLYLIDITSGAMQIAAEIPFWVTHVQFDPMGTGRIIFNREGFAEDGCTPPHNRIWCLDTDKSIRPLSPEPVGEWRAHENWALNGKSVLYHGGRSGKAFLAARTWEGQLLQETSLDGIEFWHATGMIDGRRLLVDRPDGFISIVDPEAVINRLTNLCRHDSSVAEQDHHPHPITTPNGRSAVFTSVRTGQGQVYEVSLA